MGKGNLNEDVKDNGTEGERECHLDPDEPCQKLGCVNSDAIEMNEG